MKVLLVGFGSIGKRHYEVLSELPQVQTIHIVTQQNLKEKTCFKELTFVSDIDSYDYFVIASQTNKHYEQLKFLEENLKDKLIFCEKPLFKEKKDLEIKNNKIFIGYVLRFNPLLQQLKELIKDEEVLLATAKCGQYLPSWRPDTDYRECYSAKKEEGGGVLLDLSHEIDYIQWLCGKIELLNSIQTKISNLEIDSDDLTMMIGKTDKNSFINISIDYMSKITHRKLLLETNNYTYELDFIANRLVRKNESAVEKVYELSNLQRNEMFKKMHLDIFDAQQNICSFEEAVKVMDTISMIQEQNR